MLARLVNLNITKYLLISCLASVIDLSISNYLFHILQVNYLVACNLGIAAGFLFQYFTGMKYVFDNQKQSSSFAIYLGTFALGLVLASVTMWTSFNVIGLSFFYAKLMSMIVPFFITYFVRRTLLGVKNGGEFKNENLL